MQFIAKQFNEKDRLKNETLFHTASGHLGIRGCFEEGVPDGAPSIRGAYLNGFCETEAIRYNERLYGFPEEKQVIVNLPDAQTVKLKANGRDIVCWNGTEMTRVLDMGRGVNERSFLFDTGKGKLRVCFTRLVSFVCKEIFAIECRIESLGYSGIVSVHSELNPAVKNFTDASDPRVASGNGQMLKTVSSGFRDGIMTVQVETINSGRRLVCAAVHDIDGETSLLAEGLLAFDAEAAVEENGTFVFHKYCIYRELKDGQNEEDALNTLAVCAGNGFEQMASLQKAYLDDFWRHARVIVEDDGELQTQLDFCLYGMLCSAGKDGLSNVAAKGLSGEGYEGHYFWDSEIYVFPFFLLTEPDSAKALLQYRYAHLDDARAHARRMGHTVGALYPWRTISGSECSSYYPSGSAQYHINGDIARAFTTYFDITHDTAFLPEICEVLVETARLYLDAGHWKDGKFRIDCVTGPDEYTCIVNNNYYTNSCAAANLASAARLCAELKKCGGFESLSQKLRLDESELEEFDRAAEGMFYPYSEDGRIIAQDDSFLSKKRWDLSAVPAENFPLLMHYHPLQINRCQVLKQADSVLANYLYREETELMMMRSYRYYEDITTHDSSLSNCIYAIMAARLGDMNKALRYFRKSIGTDTDDQNGNTKDGLHIANMGGAYAVMTAGFGGVRYGKDGLSLFPMLPEGVTGYSFPVCCDASRVSVRVTKEGCALQITEGEDIELTVYGHREKVSEEEVFIRRRAEAVIFDLDGVITDTASIHYKAWKKLADELGIAFDEAANENFKGVARARCLELLLEWGNVDADQGEFDDLLKRKNDYYCDMLDALTPDAVLPGIKDFLNGLTARNIPFSLFSVSKNTDRILEKIGLSDVFVHKVTGLDIENSKPHYEGYLLAAEKMKIDPRLCMMVEDSESGIKGAKALSMLTLAVMHENKADADVCVPSTASIAEAAGAILMNHADA